MTSISMPSTTDSPDHTSSTSTMVSLHRNCNQEIEDNFNEKFSGHRMPEESHLLEESRDCDKHRTGQVEDFGEKYQSLEKHSRTADLHAFKANPNLFGFPTESLGFSRGV